MTGPRKGLLVSRSGFIWLPQKLRFYCGNIGSNHLKSLRVAKGKRTAVQIECPHIIDGPPINLTTKDKEFETNHGCGWVLTATGPRTIDYNVGPFLRFWSAKPWSTGVGLDIERFDVPRLRKESES